MYFYSYIRKKFMDCTLLLYTVHFILITNYIAKGRIIQLIYIGFHKPETK